MASTNLQSSSSTTWWNAWQAVMVEVDEETLSSWPISKQLSYALSAVTEANHPVHHDGVALFSKLLGSIAASIEKQERLTTEDTNRVFAMIVKVDNPELMAKILNNGSLPGSNADGDLAGYALKQALRLNSAKVLRFLMGHGVKLKLQNFEDVKSIIFNLLHLVALKNADSTATADMFWRHLATAFGAMQRAQQEQQHNNNNNNEDDDDDQMMVSDLAQFASSAVIHCAIYKKIQVEQARRLLPILQFCAERQMVFVDSMTLGELYDRCLEDKHIDCSGMIRLQSKQHQLFWSSLTVQMMNEAMVALNRPMLKYTAARKKKQRQDALQCAQYLISNGVAKHLDEVVLPKLDEKPTSNVLRAIAFGRNVWSLKELSPEKLADLFVNICDQQIELPQSLCSLVLSFVVL